MTGVTVILYGSDRNLGSGPLRIRVADLCADGGPQRLPPGKTCDAGQLYGLTFSAPRRRPE